MGNRLLFDGTYYYTYDADGNCLMRTAVSGGAITAYTWNNANQLTSVTQYAGTDAYNAKSATCTVDYFYDAFGRMVRRVAGETTENYVYDGENLALVMGSGGVEREFYVPGTTLVLATEGAMLWTGTQPYSAVTWLLTDNQGSVRDEAVYVYNETTGLGTVAVGAHEVYDAFGQITWQGPQLPGSRNQAGFGYDSMLQDPVSGLSYARMRWYNPATGNWLSQDPIGFDAGQTNLSEFCGNSPTNEIDPSGEWSLLRYIYTGDGDAPDYVYNAATEAAGQYYLENAGDTHKALDSLGTEGKVVSLGLEALEGDALYEQIMQRQVANVHAAPQNLGQKFTRGVTEFAPVVIRMVGMMGEGVGASGGGTPVEGGAAPSSDCGFFPTCFLAGTPVVVPDDEEITSASQGLAEGQQGASHDWLCAAAAVLVGAAGQCVDKRRKKKRNEEDDFMRQLFGEDPDREDLHSSNKETLYAVLPAADLDLLAGDRVRAGHADRAERRGTPGAAMVLDSEVTGTAMALVERPADERPAVRDSTDWNRVAHRWRPLRVALRAVGRKSPPARIRGKCAWLALWLTIAAFFAGHAMWGGNSAVPPSASIAPSSSTASATSPAATRSIEAVHVGQRVVAGNPDCHDLAQSSDTIVDPASWRLLRLHAEERWADGTLDTIEVETLQPRGAIGTLRARVGAMVAIAAGSGGDGNVAGSTGEGGGRRALSTHR